MPAPLLRENSSAVIRWGTDIPSPMKRNTYFGVAPKAVHHAITAVAATASVLTLNIARTFLLSFFQRLIT